MNFKLKDYHGDILDEELMANLKCVASNLKKNSATREEYDRDGNFHSDTLRRRFGSWPKALEKAELDSSSALKKFHPNRRNNSDVTNKELLKDLKQVGTILNKSTVFIAEYKKRMCFNLFSLVRKIADFLHRNHFLHKVSPAKTIYNTFTFIISG